jgi:DNA-binding response OmpR family regulator
MKSLLLLEDDQNLGQTLKERLAQEGYRVIWSENIAQARAALLENEFDLILLDVGLPDGTGFDFAREIRESRPYPFLFITAQNSAESRLKGYDLGAEEYIPKPFHLRELLMRIRHVLKDHVAIHKLHVDSMIIDFDSMSIINQEGGTQSLPLKDFQVLKLLIERSPAVLSRDDILNQVWGEERFPSNRSVDNVILRVRQALGVRGPELIRSIRGVGYQWKVEGEDNG